MVHVGRDQHNGKKRKKRSGSWIDMRKTQLPLQAFRMGENHEPRYMGNSNKLLMKARKHFLLGPPERQTCWFVCCSWNPDLKHRKTTHFYCFNLQGLLVMFYSSNSKLIHQARNKRPQIPPHRAQCHRNNNQEP